MKYFDVIFLIEWLARHWLRKKCGGYLFTNVEPKCEVDEYYDDILILMYCTRIDLISIDFIIDLIFDTILVIETLCIMTLV